MSEENAKCPPAGYHEIPRRAGSSVWEEAVAITAVVVIFGLLLFCFGILFAITWPWGLVAFGGILTIYGAAVFILLHMRNNSE